MAIEKTIDPRGYFILILSALPLIASTNIDCHGRPFYCVNSTHFMICVDFGGGLSSTMDDYILACPEPTVCDTNNLYECEFPLGTTETGSPQGSSFTTPSTTMGTTWSEAIINTISPTTSTDFQTSESTDMNVTNQIVNQNNGTVFPETTTEPFTKEIASINTTSNEILNTKIKSSTDASMTTESINITESYSPTNSDNWTKPKTSTSHSMHAPNSNDTTVITDSNVIYSSPGEVTTKRTIVGETIIINSTVNDKVTTEPSDFSQITSKIQPVDGTFSSTTSSDNIQTSNNIGEPIVNINLNTTSDSLSEMTTEILINKTTTTNGFKTDTTNITKDIVDNTKVTTEASDVSQLFSTIMTNNSTKLVDSTLSSSADGLKTDVTNTIQEETKITTETNNISELISTTMTNLPIIPIGSTLNSITSSDNIQISNSNVNESTISTKSNATSDLLSEVTTEGSINNTTNSDGFMTDVTNTMVNDSKVTTEASDVFQSVSTITSNINTPIVTVHLILTSESLPEVTTETLITKITSTDGYKDSSPNITNATIDAKSTTEVKNASQLFSTIMSNTSTQPIDITTSSITTSDNINSSITNIYESITLTNDNVRSTLPPEMTTEGIIDRTTTVITTTDSSPNNTNTTANDTKDTTEVNNATQLFSTIRSNSSTQPIDITTSSITTSDNIQTSNTKIDELIIITNLNATSTLLPEATTERIINIITSADRRTDITNNIPNNINVTREASKDSMLTSTIHSDNIKVINTNEDEPIITTDFNVSSNLLQLVTTEGLNKITNTISSTTDVTLITTPMDSDKNATTNMANTLTQVINSSLTSITPSDNIQTTNTNIGGATTAAELNPTTASLPKVTTGMINKITSVDSSNEPNIMVNNSKITTEPNGIFGLFSTTSDGILAQPIDGAISSTTSYDNIQMTNVINIDKPIIMNSSNSTPVVPPEVSRRQTTSSDSVQTFIGFVDQVKTTVRSMSNDDANLTSYIVSDSNPIGESNNNDLTSTTYSEMSTQKPIMNPVSLKNSNNIHSSTLNIGNPIIIKESNETANVTTVGIISTVDFTNKEVLNESNVTMNGSQATTYRNNVVDLLSQKTNDLQTKPISVTSSMTTSDQLQITNKVDVLTATDSHKPVLSSQYTTTLTTLTGDVFSEIKTTSELTPASELFTTSPTYGKTVITFNPSKSSDYSYSANMNGDMNNANVHKNSNLKPSLSPEEKTDGLMSSVDRIHQELSIRSPVSNYTDATTKTTTIDLFSIIMNNTDANTLMSTDSNLILALPTTNMVSLTSTNTNNISDPTNIISVSTTINNNSNSKPNIETISTFVNIEPKRNINSAMVPETTTERLFNVIHTASNDVPKIHSTVMSHIKQFTRIPDLKSSNWEKSTISPVNPATASVYSLLLDNNVTNSISTESNIKSIFDEKPAEMSSVDFTPNVLYTIYNNPITEIFESSVITMDAKKNSTITILKLNDLKDSDINTTQATATRYSHIINNLLTEITTESPDDTKTTTIDPVNSKILNSLKISDPEVTQKSITQYISSPSKSALSYKLYASSADMRQPVLDTNTYMPPNFLPGGRTTISKDPREVSQSPGTLIENLFYTNSRILKPGKWKRMGANSDEETVSTDNKTLAVSDTEEVTTSRPVEKLTHSSYYTPAPKHDLTGIGTTMSDQIRYSNGFYSTKNVESTMPLIILLANTSKALHTTPVSVPPKNSLHKQSPISEIETTTGLPAIIGSYHKMGNHDKVESTNIHDSSISEDDEHEQATIMHTSNNSSDKNNKKQFTSLNKIDFTSTNFDCTHRNRGRYADTENCTKLYICIGQRHPIIGSCPDNTVFSETWKQCTNNLSHCVRNNQFRCILEGRFADLIQDNVYYICVKNSNNSFFRVKLQCLVGYHLNKATLKCDLNEEDKSQSESMNTSASRSDTKSISDESKTSSKPEFECYKEGVFPDPTDSTRYYVCTKYKSQYRKKKKKCHTDEVFHKDKKICVDADSIEY